MFEILVASVVPAHRSPFQVAGAIAIHAGLLLVAIVATRGAALAGPAPDPARFLPEVYINRVSPAPVTGSASVTRSVSLARPDLPTRMPLPGIDFQRLPAHLPPSDFDRSAYAGGTTLIPSDLTGGSGSPDGVTTVPRNDEVDQPARRVHVVEPVYPSALRTAGIEGSVRLSFIIDTLGNVEPGSVTVLAASRPGFVVSATTAVRGQRFIPAQRRGVVVRTRAEQTVRFALGEQGTVAQP